MKLTVKSFWRSPRAGLVYIEFADPFIARSKKTPEGNRTMRILYKLVGQYFSYGIEGSRIEFNSALLPARYDSLAKLQIAMDRDANTKLKLTHNIKVQDMRPGEKERFQPVAAIAALNKLREDTSGECVTYASMIVRGNLPLTGWDASLIRELGLGAEICGPADEAPFNKGISVVIHRPQDDPWRELEALMPAIRKTIV